MNAASGASGRVSADCPNPTCLHGLLTEWHCAPVKDRRVRCLWRRCGTCRTVVDPRGRWFHEPRGMAVGA